MGLRRELVLATARPGNRTGQRGFMVYMTDGRHRRLWLLVCSASLQGALGLALYVFYGGHRAADMNLSLVALGADVLAIAPIMAALTAVLMWVLATRPELTLKRFQFYATMAIACATVMALYSLLAVLGVVVDSTLGPMLEGSVPLPDELQRVGFAFNALLSIGTLVLAAGLIRGAYRDRTLRLRD